MHKQVCIQIEDGPDEPFYFVHHVSRGMAVDLLVNHWSTHLQPGETVGIVPEGGAVWVVWRDANGETLAEDKFVLAWVVPDA